VCSEKRLYEIYAFCAASTMLLMEVNLRKLRRSELVRWREDVMALYRGRPPARLAGLTAPVARFSLKRDDFLAVIEGMEMDATEDIQAPNMAKLDLYCDRVASAVGRFVGASVRNAGSGRFWRSPIISDVLCNSPISCATSTKTPASGRLYPAARSLLAAGIEATRPAEVLAHRLIGQACGPVVARAQALRRGSRHYEKGSGPTVRTPRIMYEAYRSILDRLAQRGWEPPRERIRVGKLRLFRILLQVGLF